MTDIPDRIKEMANQPREASDDSGSMKQFGMNEMIAADKHIKNDDEEVKTSRFAGIKFRKISPPGTV